MSVNERSGGVVGGGLEGSVRELLDTGADSGEVCYMTEEIKAEVSPHQGSVQSCYLLPW